MTRWSFYNLVKYKLEINIMSSKITVYCCHRLLCEGIKKLVKEAGIEANCTINSYEPKNIIEPKPELLIVDCRSLSCVLIETFSKFNVKILLLRSKCVSIVDDQQIFDLISQGIVGIIAPTADGNTFKKALKCVLSGGLWFERNSLLEPRTDNNDTAEEIPHLTAKEMEIVRMICRGHSNKEIKNELSLTQQSVKSHLNRIFRKVGVADRVQLAIFAIKTFNLLLQNSKHEKK